MGSGFLGKKLSGDELKALPSSKKEAQVSGLDYFFTGQPCKRGHIAQRRTKNGGCFECISEAKKRYREKNPKKIQEFNRSRLSPEYRRKQNAQKRKRYAGDQKYKDSQRDQGLKQLYGVGLDFYQSLFSIQEGRCAICNETDTGRKQTVNLDLDHCHVTKTIRGLLCSPCNKLLGAAKDDVITLRRAINYLERGVDFRDDQTVQNLLRKKEQND